MKNEFQKHYEAIKARGLITDKTTIVDFLEKLVEETNEFITEAKKCTETKEITPEFVHEGMDVIGVIANCMTHLNIDVEEEFKKNVIHQQTRED